jgi:hypothetical protein
VRRPGAQHRAFTDDHPSFWSNDVPNITALDRAEKITAFRELCVTEARLYGLGKSLHDAVDRCQNYAVAFGLVDDLGQDEIQLIMATAFGDRPGGPPKKQLKKGDFDPFGETP